MVREHVRRKQSRRRWKTFVTIYWIVLVASAAVGVELLVVSDEAASTKWMIGIVGGLFAGLLVHWGAMQTMALRE